MMSYMGKAWDKTSSYYFFELKTSFLMVNFVHYFGCKGSNYFLITKQKAEKILFFLLLVDLYSVW